MGLEILILTGMSGAGKTHAAKSFEDKGYYCVDNMPAVMISEFVNIYKRVPNKKQMVVFVIDVRGESEFHTLIEQLELIKTDNKTRLIFLDCDDDVIVTRYKETRRMHPLSAVSGLSVIDAIKAERELLSEAKQRADFVVDTTKLKPAQLREVMNSLTADNIKGGVSVSVLSFGFKYGIPTDADLVFDVRCFPNPFYIAELKEKTGLDTEVSDYVLSHTDTTDFIAKLIDMTDFLMPLYVNESRAQLVIAIGCTGGKHRSVCIAEQLKTHLRETGYFAAAIHRDIGKN
ncbi:nucleotide-binding protein YvcJ [Clostridia bacterium]|nr:nucleotide-binding protein YvcJ [Clostridia bacterium]